MSAATAAAEPATTPPTALPVDRIQALAEHIQAAPQLNLFVYVCTTARVEDLGEEEQVYFKHVKANGKGVCSYCRYRHGCLRCDHVKAWRFVINWELRKRGYRDPVVTLEDGFSPSELSKVFRTKTKISSY